MAETILWWLFLIFCTFAFFFGYGIVGNLIRRCIRGRQTRKKSPNAKIDNSPDPSGNGHAETALH